MRERSTLLLVDDLGHGQSELSNAQWLASNQFGTVEHLIFQNLEIALRSQAKNPGVNSLNMRERSTL